jgi:chromatin assembly factor 1 subunit A
MPLNFHFVSTPMQVQVIRSCRDGINKVVELLQQRFPNVSKSQLKSKVREISDFVDNHWKVRVLSNS